MSPTTIFIDKCQINVLNMKQISKTIWQSLSDFVKCNAYFPTVSVDQSTVFRNITVSTLVFVRLDSASRKMDVNLFSQSILFDISPSLSRMLFVYRWSYFNRKRYVILETTRNWGPTELSVNSVFWRARFSWRRDW